MFLLLMDVSESDMGLAECQEHEIIFKCAACYHKNTCCRKKQGVDTSRSRDSFVLLSNGPRLAVITTHVSAHYVNG
jgi:hypothetical protein